MHDGPPIVGVDNWQQYAFRKQSFRNDTVYAVLFHVTGCSDCDIVLPKWRNAIYTAGIPKSPDYHKLPVLMEYHIGELKEYRRMRDEGKPHRIKHELESINKDVSGDETAAFPTLVIFRGKKPLMSYGDKYLRELSTEEIYNVLEGFEAGQREVQHI